ncbi:ATPase [Floricoccus penangensis]|uniref:ATPase n=1 Tax=Floricoccus penangensis TaxID=1859475 RepID=A0A9Q5JGX4_9LACT|nr:HAD-IC family P-type ATPase [Floricoccus penangensis]OFI47215.1 ATPase [Floricoccus penangensis]
MEYLTKEQVKNAKKNVDKDKTTRSTWDIILSNTFTFINGMVLVIALFVATTFRFENLTFVFVIIINTLIGSFQEIRSKRALENLQLLSRSKYKVNRDNKTVEVYSEDIVEGEYLHLSLGDQVPVDGYIISGQIEVDESLLTGESDNIHKSKDDHLLSGSNVVSGSSLIKVTAVGADSYINQFAQKSKRFKKYPSELRDNLNKILKIISLLMVPIALLLVVRGISQGRTYNSIVLSTSGALIGMIPEGLMLLVSVSLAVSAYKLSKKKVLVQELYCVETLARVDTLCFDKTGTITTGQMEVVETSDKVEEVLKNYLSYFDDENATSIALKNYLKLEKSWHVRKIGAFSSKNKYSFIQVEGEGTYFFGADEFLNLNDSIPEHYQDMKKQGFRVLTLVKSSDYVEIPENLSYIGSVVLSDKIKENTKETFEYFESQDVSIKIISGDNHLAVLGVAIKAGFNPNAKAVDMSKVELDDFERVVLENDIFGRVTPTQKEAMVEILQKDKKTVAMSGDGVNDVLALKKADVSFAMNGATSAAKSVSNIVFLTDDFSVFYDILMEGRRVINNIQKVASLFLTKTFFSIIFAILSIIFALKFPFTPIQFTLISTITIGIPSFFLTFEENKNKVKPDFMKSVMTNALVGGGTLVLAVLLTNIFIDDSSKLGIICISLALLNGLLMIVRVSRPLNRYKMVLLMFLTIAAIMAVVIDVFYLDKSQLPFTLYDFVISGLMMGLVIFAHFILDKKVK